MVQFTLVWLVLTQAVPAAEPDVRVSGVVRAADGQVPIAGVAVKLSNGRTQEQVTTDEFYVDY